MAFCISHGQHNSRSPLDVGFLSLFCNINVIVLVIVEFV